MREDYSSERLGKRLLDWLQEGRYQEIIDCTDRILAEDQNNYEAWMGRCFALVILERGEEAKEAQSKAFACMTPEVRRMYAEALAANADETARAFEEKLDALALQQEKIGFKSESERREYYQESERMLKEMKESAADFKRMFPKGKGRSEKKKRDIS